MNEDILYKFVINGKYVTPAYTLDHIITYGLSKEHLIHNYIDKNLCYTCERGGCGELICPLYDFAITDVLACTYCADDNGDFIFIGDIVEVLYTTPEGKVERDEIVICNSDVAWIRKLREILPTKVRIIGNIFQKLNIEDLEYKEEEE